MRPIASFIMSICCAVAISGVLAFSAYAESRACAGSCDQFGNPIPEVGSGPTTPRLAPPLRYDPPRTAVGNPLYRDEFGNEFEQTRDGRRIYRGRDRRFSDRRFRERRFGKRRYRERYSGRRFSHQRRYRQHGAFRRSDSGFDRRFQQEEFGEGFEQTTSRRVYKKQRRYKRKHTSRRYTKRRHEGRTVRRHREVRRVRPSLHNRTRFCRKTKEKVGHGWRSKWVTVKRCVWVRNDLLHRHGRVSRY